MAFVKRKFIKLNEMYFCQLSKWPKKAILLTPKQFDNLIGEAFPDNALVSAGFAMADGLDMVVNIKEFKRQEQTLFKYVQRKFSPPKLDEAFEENGEFFYNFNSKDSKKYVCDFLSFQWWKFKKIGFDNGIVFGLPSKNDNKIIYVTGYEGTLNFLKFLQKQAPEESYFLRESSIKKLVGSPLDFVLEGKDYSLRFANGKIERISGVKTEEIRHAIEQAVKISNWWPFLP